MPRRIPFARPASAAVVVIAAMLASAPVFAHAAPMAGAATPTAKPAQHNADDSPKADDSPQAGDLKAGKISIGVAGFVRAHGAQYSAFQVDAGGAQSPDGMEVGTRATIKLDLVGKASASESLSWGLHLATDVASGTVVGRYGDGDLAGDRRPSDSFDAVAPLAMYAAADYKGKIGLRVGQMTSNWGTGMLANDGMQAFDKRYDAWFTLPGTGDRVNRALFFVRPWAGTSSNLRGLVVMGAADRVVQDDVQWPQTDSIRAAWSPNTIDKAEQVIGAARMYLAKEQWVGLYYVYRTQNHADGKKLDVHAFDAAADLDMRPKTRDGYGDGLWLRAEYVLLSGTTTLAPSPEYPEHDVNQTGFTALARYDSGKLRAELDLNFATGDATTDDKTIRNFKNDPNAQMGLVLFRRVLAWQSARARLTASDPLYVGEPNEDLERLATAGSVTNTLSIFPKIGYEVTDGLSIYGGALLAWALADPLDPFHTRTKGGGTARNYLDAKPADSMYGIELDVGVRYQHNVAGGLLAAGIEYGALMAGGALQGPNGDELGTITGGRFVLSWGPNPTAK